MTERPRQQRTVSVRHCLRRHLGVSRCLAGPGTACWLSVRIACPNVTPVGDHLVHASIARVRQPHQLVGLPAGIGVLSPAWRWRRGAADPMIARRWRSGRSGRRHAPWRIRAHGFVAIVDPGRVVARCSPSGPRPPSHTRRPSGVCWESSGLRSVPVHPDRSHTVPIAGPGHRSPIDDLAPARSRRGGLPVSLGSRRATDSAIEAVAVAPRVESSPPATPRTLTGRGSGR